MSYTLKWYSNGLQWAQKADIEVLPGAVVTNKAPIVFTGKGAANYGKAQQENMMHLLENFAGPSSPSKPTVGQTWYDTLTSALKVCTNTTANGADWTGSWRSLNGTQVTNVGEPAPTPAVLGDTWFQRTGSSSGVLYVYTGLGRYPEVNWNAANVGYFPANSTTMAALLNYQSFTQQNFGEVFISAKVNGVQTDEDGTILIDGQPTIVPRNHLATQFPITDGYIVWDRTGTMISTGTASGFFSVRQLIDGTWQYDNNAQWVSFIPTADMYVIGTIQVAEQDDATAPGVSAASIFAEAIELRKMTNVPAAKANGAIGGWEQIYPPVDVAAGREEYDYVLQLVSQLIGDTSAFGGGGALGRAISNLPSLRTLDASLQAAWKAGAPRDQVVLSEESLLSNLKIDVNSNDWDELLAAAKYAINRLELPAGFVDDISDMPFVLDGRTPPQYLLDINPSVSNDVALLAPSTRRKINRHRGIGQVTLQRLYQETVNVLAAAIQNRYVLKGIQGTTGVNQTFGSTVGVAEHVTFVVNAAGNTLASTVTNGVSFNFGTADVNLERFFAAGQAIEVIVRTAPSTSKTAADTNLGNLASQFGRFRITQDSVYIMDNSVTPAMTQARQPTGFAACTQAGSTLASASVAGASFVLRGQAVPSNGNMKLFLDLNAGGATTGNVYVTWNLITDNELYDVSKRVYPTASAYVDGSDKLGSAAFVVGAAPVETPVTPPALSTTVNVTGRSLTIATSETGDAGVKFTGVGFRNDGFIYTTTAASGTGATPTVIVDNTAGNWLVGKPLANTESAKYEIKFDVVSGTANQNDASKLVGVGPCAQGTWYNLGSTREFGRQIWLKQAATSASTDLTFKVTIRDVATKTTQAISTFSVTWNTTRS